MFEKTSNNPIKIIRKLVLWRSCFGAAPSWKWKKQFPAKRFRLGKRSNPHIAITGESGGGKSNACMTLAKELHRKGFNLIILDPNDDYLGIADEIGADVYDASSSELSIFDPGAMTETEKTAELVSMLSRRLRLGHLQAAKLRRCIGYCYWITKRENRMPSMKDLLYTVSRFKARASAGELHVLNTLADRLSLLHSGQISRSIDMSALMKRSSIFSISRLHTEEAQAVYMEGLLRSIYGMMLEGKCRGGAYLIIDEARKVGGSASLARLASEGRKYGLGLIAISQGAKQMDCGVLSNSSLFISFRQREPAELNYSANYIAGGNELGRFLEVKKGIRNLRTGEAVILDSSAGEPLIARFPRCEARGTSLELLILSIASLGASRHRLLAEARLRGFSVEEASLKVGRMAAEGKIAESEIHSGRLKGQWYIANARHSAEHDLMVSLISRKLAARGIRNEIRNTSYGPDIVAYTSQGSIAIEYETGRKSMPDTIAMLKSRKSRYSMVVVIVNDEHYPRYTGIEGIELASASSFLEE